MTQQCHMLLAMHELMQDAEGEGHTILYNAVDVVEAPDERLKLATMTVGGGNGLHPRRVFERLAVVSGHRTTQKLLQFAA